MTISDFKVNDLQIGNRFIVNLPKEFNIPQYLIKEIFFTQTFSSFSQSFEFQISIYESVDVPVLKILVDKMRSQTDDYAKFNIDVFLVDLTGVLLNTWKIMGCFIKEITPSRLDYSESEPLIISLKINSDYFEIE